jgi:hypothetical protein
MKNLALWTLGLGLSALACVSGDGTSSQPTPPAGNTPVNPAPRPNGGTPSVTPAPPPMETPPPTMTMPPVVTPPVVTPPTMTTPPVVTPPGTTPTPTPPVVTPPASAPDAGPSTPAPTGPRGPYTCSLVIGISATGDWFKAGFEKIVDNDRWQLMAVHSAFINYWADAKHSIWGSKPSSACTKNADNPDRVILTALSNHWENYTVDQWVTEITGAVKNFKARYSNLKNLELETFVRSPGDKPCPLGDTFRNYSLDPADQAFQKVAAMFPELVTVAPKVHVDSCADYNNHPPHLQLAGPASRAAMKMGAIYKDTAYP